MNNPSQTHSSRRVNYLASHLNAKNYLEVGVARGDTFFSVDIERKLAVDPKFRFDCREHEDDKTIFREVPSDLFFTDFYDGKKFDIIFLDGLHTFSQTFRDFCSSLITSHERTVWLIDDTMPCDAFSAWPNHAESLTFRRKAGLSGGQWHGDVFKVIFAIHDFFPTLSYITINTKGNPQTLVWKAPRENFEPFYNDFDLISRMTYFDLLKHIQVMNMLPEEQALSKILDSLVK